MALAASRPGRRGLPVALVIVACGLAPLTRPGPARATSPTEPEPVRLAVSTFNIEYGGTHVSFDKVVEAIVRGGADVVGIEEAQGHIPRLARELGWPYFSERLQVVSRYPLIDPPDGDGRYLFVELTPGEVVAIENVHLTSAPYGPYKAIHGATRKELASLERRVRLPEIRPYLRIARGLLALGIPVFLVGDFNSPSWRDWTTEMVGARPQIRFPMRWPVSLAVERAGFLDAYRTVHPDPTRDPGLTWPATRPRLQGWNPGPRSPTDRIDLVFAAGDAEVTDSIILGERGVPFADISVRPWPSDHRGVVSTFEVSPAELPVLVAVAHRLRDVGQDVAVRFHASGTPSERIAVVPAGGDPVLDVIEERATDGTSDGTMTFATAGWTPGAYEAVLLDGDVERSRIGFWLEEPGTDPILATGKEIYEEGEPIDVSWNFAPGRRWDWVGIYKRGRNPRAAWYLLWVYTGATIQGSAVLGSEAYGRWPLPEGRYSAYLLADDGYRLEARADFAIVDRGPPG